MDYIALLDIDYRCLPNNIKKQIIMLEISKEIELICTNRNYEHFAFFWDKI